MNFRTLIMLAVAALVIVVAVKMNQNPPMETALAEETDGYDNESVMLEDNDSIGMTDEEAEALAVEAVTDEAITDEEVVVEDDEMEGTSDDMMDSSEMVTGEDETEAVIDGEEMSDEETDYMAPAVVNESPKTAIENAPAEDVSDEPVAPAE